MNVEKIPIHKAVKASTAPVKMESFAHKDEKRDPGHMPSLPNHASATHKKTRSVTPRVKDINQVQPALQQFFQEEKDQPDPMMPTQQELQTGYLQPQQPGMGQGAGQGMPGLPPGQGMPMGRAPGGPPRGKPPMPTQKYRGKPTGNTLSEMI